jgi:HSP20 family molecular chaperone IbpA
MSLNFVSPAGYGVCDCKNLAQVLKEKTRTQHILVNIDSTIKALNDILSGAARIDVKSQTPDQHASLGGLLDTRINISILGFEDLFENPHRRKIYPQLGRSEQLIDVIDDKDSLRVIAHFPGLKKQDIDFEVEDGAIQLKIREGGHTRYSTIPCDVKPNQVSVTSTTYNNSVLEIVFKKI